MRKLSGFLAVVLVALGGAYLAWPDRFMAHWKSLEVLAERQLFEELATFEQLRSGDLKIGASPAKMGASSPSAGASRVLVSSPPLKRAKSPKMAAPAKPVAPLIMEPARTSLAPEQGAADPLISTDSTPEAALGAILKHEIRENQAKEETFWTEERIQEALKNGSPKSNSAPCLAFCGNNDTVIEINMPKSPTEGPKKP